MPSRPNVHISLSSTDVLIAMLSSDLSGSHGVGGLVRSGSREQIDLAAGSGELQIDRLQIDRLQIDRCRSSPLVAARCR